MHTYRIDDPVRILEPAGAPIPVGATARVNQGPIASGYLTIRMDDEWSGYPVGEVWSSHVNFIEPISNIQPEPTP